MPAIVAVGENLSHVKEYLNKEGLATTGLNGLEQAAVIVVSSLADNYLGDQKARAEVPVVEAKGLSEAQILNEVKRAINLSK